MYGLHEVVPDLGQRLARAQVREVLARHLILLPDGVHDPMERLDAPVPSDALFEPGREFAGLVLLFLPKAVRDEVTRFLDIVPRAVAPLPETFRRSPDDAAVLQAGPAIGDLIGDKRGRYGQVTPLFPAIVFECAFRPFFNQVCSINKNPATPERSPACWLDSRRRGYGALPSWHRGRFPDVVRGEATGCIDGGDRERSRAVEKQRGADSVTVGKRQGAKSALGDVTP